MEPVFDNPILKFLERLREFKGSESSLFNEFLLYEPTSRSPFFFDATTPCPPSGKPNVIGADVLRSIVYQFGAFDEQKFQHIKQRFRVAPVEIDVYRKSMCKNKNQYETRSSQFINKKKWPNLKEKGDFEPQQQFTSFTPVLPQSTDKDSEEKNFWENLISENHHHKNKEMANKKSWTSLYWRPENMAEVHMKCSDEVFWFFFRVNLILNFLSKNFQSNCIIWKYVRQLLEHAFPYMLLVEQHYQNKKKLKEIVGEYISTPPQIDFVFSIKDFSKSLVGTTSRNRINVKEQRKECLYDCFYALIKSKRFDELRRRFDVSFTSLCKSSDAYCLMFGIEISDIEAVLALAQNEFDEYSVFLTLVYVIRFIDKHWANKGFGDDTSIKLPKELVCILLMCDHVKFVLAEAKMEEERNAGRREIERRVLKDSYLAKDIVKFLSCYPKRVSKKKMFGEVLGFDEMYDIGKRDFFVDELVLECENFAEYEKMVNFTNIRTFSKVAPEVLRKVKMKNPLKGKFKLCKRNFEQVQYAEMVKKLLRHVIPNRALIRSFKNNLVKFYQKNKKFKRFINNIVIVSFFGLYNYNIPCEEKFVPWHRVSEFVTKFVSRSWRKRLMFIENNLTKEDGEFGKINKTNEIEIMVKEFFSYLVSNVPRIIENVRFKSNVSDSFDNNIITRRSFFEKIAHNAKCLRRYLFYGKLEETIVVKTTQKIPKENNLQNYVLEQLRIKKLECFVIKTVFKGELPKSLNFEYTVEEMEKKYGESWLQALKSFWETFNISDLEDCSNNEWKGVLHQTFDDLTMVDMMAMSHVFRDRFKQNKNVPILFLMLSKEAVSVLYYLFDFLKKLSCFVTKFLPLQDYVAQKFLYSHSQMEEIQDEVFDNPTPDLLVLDRFPDKRPSDVLNYSIRKNTIHNIIDISELFEIPKKVKAKQKKEKKKKTKCVKRGIGNVNVNKDGVMESFKKDEVKLLRGKFQNYMFFREKSRKLIRKIVKQEIFGNSSECFEFFRRNLTHFCIEDNTDETLMDMDDPIKDSEEIVPYAGLLSNSVRDGVLVEEKENGDDDNDGNAMHLDHRHVKKKKRKKTLTNFFKDNGVDANNVDCWIFFFKRLKKINKFIVFLRKMCKWYSEVPDQIKRNGIGANTTLSEPNGYSEELFKIMSLSPVGKVFVRKEMSVKRNKCNKVAYSFCAVCKQIHIYQKNRFMGLSGKHLPFYDDIPICILCKNKYMTKE
jgi:hypothetical protein